MPWTIDHFIMIQIKVFVSFLFGLTLAQSSFFRKEYCDVKLSNSKNLIADIDTPNDYDFLEILNKELCSERCPCPIEALEIFKELSENDLLQYRRSFDDLVFSNQETTYTSFQECWNNKLSESGIYSEDTVDEFDDFLPIIEEIETQKSCSGICESGLSWYTKSVLDQRPTDSCLTISENSDNGLTGALDLMIKLSNSSNSYSGLDAVSNALNQLIWLIVLVVMLVLITISPIVLGPLLFDFCLTGSPVSFFWALVIIYGWGVILMRP